MDEHCINCGKNFEKKNKGYKRKSIDSVSKIPALSFRKILENTFNEPITPEKKLFICEECAASCVKVENLKSAHKQFQTVKSSSSYLGKRKHSNASKAFSSTPTRNASHVSFSVTPFSSPIRKKSNVSVRSTASSSSSSSFIDKAVEALRDYKYYAAFRHLLKNSKAAKAAFTKLIKYTVNQEMKNIKHQEIPVLSSKLSDESLNSFSWKDGLEQVEAQLPVLSTAVRAAISPKRTESKLSFENKGGPLVPAYGFVMSTLLNLRLPSKFSFLQETLSVEMYRSGCNQKLFKWLNKLGLCRSVTTTRKVIDRLCEDFDKEIKLWKNNIQHDLGNFNNDDRETMMIQADNQSIYSDASTDIFEISNEDIISSSESSDDNDVPADISDVNDDLDGIVPLLESSTLFENSTHVVEDDIIQQLDPGYALCWDNVQKLSVCRHNTSQNNNKMMLWALCFATRNRISFRHLDYDIDTCPAIEIPVEEYLPSENDWSALRERMEIMTQRILKRNFAAFADAEVEMHIPHKYSVESSLKSQIVNLGVIKENPSTCKGVIQIMKELHRYVPATANGDPYQLICHGDQLSIERMIDAKLAMAGSEHPFDQLLGLVPRGQGFHKRNIILQDAMNAFFCGKTAVEKGTLFQIRNKFEYRNVKKRHQTVLTVV